MKKPEYSILPGGDFAESFLTQVKSLEWPNELLFVVWSAGDDVSYRITTKTVLEYHHLRTGTGPLDAGVGGIPLTNVFLTYEEEYTYWANRIQSAANQGYDAGTKPISIEFNSPLFGNRQRNFLTRDRHTGILVVCRKVLVEVDHDYDGPRPMPNRIPSLVNTKKNGKAAKGTER